ncbi:MAG: hypothetical protein Phyf2KO_07630 [Phycisphaerales bacterium]
MRTLVFVLIGMLAWAMPASAQVSKGDSFGGFAETPVVAISAKVSGDAFVPGQRGFLVVVLDHGDELHSWPSVEQDVLKPQNDEFALRTEIGVQDGPEFLTFGPVQWPEPALAKVPDVTGESVSTDDYTYKGRALAYVPFIVSQDAPEASVSLSVSVFLQACDETQCYIPQNEVVQVEFAVASEVTTGQRVDPDFDGFDAGVFDREWIGQPQADEESVVVENEASVDSEGEAASLPGVKFLGLVELPAPGSPLFLIAIALFGAIGGFVLNLTPCVLPVIPIKIMTLTQHAGESRARAVVLGTWMALGVIVFWSALSIPVLSIKGLADPSVIFGIWWLTSGIGVVIIVMSTGLMGMFNISLPQTAYKLNPKADNAFGSFLFGVMTAVLGLPCFGFVVGALLPAATTAGSLTVVVVFVSLGVGMALPYLVLAMFPGLLKKVPKTGPASDLVKQVMGLLLMAAGAYFIGSGLLALVAERPYLAKVLHWWAAGLFVAFAGIWLVYRTVRITPKALPRGVFSILAMLLTAAGILVAQNQTGQARERWEQKEAARLEQLASAGYSTTSWNEYSDELFGKALADGKVVVLDFTAEWCLNCKALKAAVLNVEPVKGKILDEEVVAFEVDLTARSAPGWAKLRELGQTGIPTLAVYGPGLEEGPWIANVYGSGQVLAAIEDAGGSAGGTSRGDLSLRAEGR